MKNQVFVVYNKVSERYGEVFASANTSTASREFLTRLSGSPLFKREDFTLFHCGSVDVESGRFDLSEIRAVPLADTPLSFENEITKQ